MFLQEKYGRISLRVAVLEKARSRVFVRQIFRRRCDRDRLFFPALVCSVRGLRHQLQSRRRKQCGGF